LLDAFLIEVFPLYSVVFARLYYGGPLLGVDLAVARECEPPSRRRVPPCDACISGDLWVFFKGSFWFGFGLILAGCSKSSFFPSYKRLFGLI